MTVHQRLGRAQAVLVLGSDDENRSIYIDRAWLAPGETGTEAFEQVSKHRRSYTGGLIFPATELRAYLLSFVSSRVAFVESRGVLRPPTPDLMDWGKKLQMNRASRCAGYITGRGVIATTI